MNDVPAQLESAAGPTGGAAGRVACEHARECAGCPLIHLPYTEQLEHKWGRVKAAAAPYPTLAGLAIEPVASAEPVVGYRVRAKLMVGPPRAGETGATIGLFARAGRGEDPHRVVDLPACRVLTPALHEVTSELRELLRNPPAIAGECLLPEAQGGLLSAFDLREVSDGEHKVLVTLVLRVASPGSGRGRSGPPSDFDRIGAQSPPRDDELAEAARAIRELSPAIAGVAVNYRAPRAVQVLGATTRTLWGASAARDRVGSLYRLATHGSFTQVHRGQAARIEEWIAEQLGSSEARVLDLYGGSGALSLPLARKGAKVTLVESFRPSAECAERAAQEQNLDGFVVRPGDAATALSELGSRGELFDVVIANPPRRGLPPAVRGAMAALRPRLVAYVSCDPETLCRDLDHLARLGYRPDRLRPVDMIPLTDQVETVAFLRRAALPSRPLVYEDDDIFVFERLAHDPEPRQGDPTRQAHVVSAGAPGTSGLAIGCKSASIETALQEALATPRAARVHLVVARGVTAREGTVGRKNRYVRLARIGGHSILRVTTRGHPSPKIERDLAAIGHPVVGDARCGHGPTNRHFDEKYALDRPFLHCIKVEFEHPRTGARVVAKGTLPGELALVLGRLGLVALDVAEEVMVG